MSNHDGTALLVVDVQRDFCPGGALAVSDADQVVPILNRFIEWYRGNGRVYASRDWHPVETVHFEPYGGPWPVHCVAGSPGAEFHPGLKLPPDAVVVSKGQAPAADGYSAFEGHTGDGTPFRRALDESGVTHLYVGGLATDYCVRQSVLDARRIGFRTTVITDAVAGVERTSGDCVRALEEMQAAGAELKTASEILTIARTNER